jgi:hypothetical protein
VRPHLRGGQQHQQAGKRDEQADDASADAPPPRLAGTFVTVPDSVTPSLATGGICLAGSTFVARLDRGCHHHSVRRPELSCRDAEISRAFPQPRWTVAAAASSPEGDTTGGE